MEYMSEADIRRRIVVTVLVIGVIIAVLGYAAVSFFERKGVIGKKMTTTGINNDQMGQSRTGGLNDVLENEKNKKPAATMSLELAQPRNSYNTGETITVFVTADSKGQPITGYDTVIRYDTAKMKLQDTINQLEEMQFVVTSENINDTTAELIITGIKRIDATGNILFNKTHLAELTFAATAPGRADLDIIFQPGSKQDSNMMNDMTEDVLGSAKGIQVQIR